MVADSVVPPELRDRAETARAELEPNDVEWSRSSAPELSTDTSTVLSIASLPVDHREVLALFHRWYQQLDIDAQIHLIEPSANPRSNTIASTLRSLGRNSTRPAPDVVTAVRAVGWTVTAIDRFDVDNDGMTQRWVDLRATNVVAQARRAGD